MQCPKCRYEPTLAEIQASPDQCPSCGVCYGSAPAGSAGNASSSGTPGAIAAEEARRAHAAAEREMAVARSAGGQAVTIVDLDVPFLSMVRFMIMWALATIPAVIVLYIIFWIAAGFLGGVMR